MHQHANCLELILKILMESNLNDICPYSSLLNITPIDDDFFKMIKQGRFMDVKSENLEKELKKCKRNLVNSLDKHVPSNQIGSVPRSQVVEVLDSSKKFQAIAGKCTLNNFIGGQSLPRRERD